MTRYLSFYCKVLVLMIFVFSSIVGAQAANTTSQAKSAKSAVTTIVTPDLYGKTKAQADSTLKKLGLATGEVVYETTGKGKAGTVVDQSPKAKTSITKGSTVNLWILKPKGLFEKQKTGLSSTTSAKSIKPKLVERNKKLFLEFPIEVRNVTIKDRNGKLIKRFQKGRSFDITKSLKDIKTATISVYFTPPQASQDPVPKKASSPEEMGVIMKIDGGITAQEAVEFEDGPDWEPTTSMSAVPDGVLPDYPARITRISGTARPGYAITIHGVYFGYREGLVKMATDATRGSEMMTLHVLDWRDDGIDCEIPRDLADEVGTTPLSAYIHIWPAQVEENPGLMSTSAPEWVGADDSGLLPSPPEPRPHYPYSGTEGPMYVFDIEPLVPVIRSLSETEVTEGDTFTIRGRDFEYWDRDTENREVRITSGGEDIPVSIESWSEDRIRVRIPNGEIDDFAGPPGPRSLDCRVTVINELQNESSTRLITVERFDDVDLTIAYVEMTWIEVWLSHLQDCRLFPAVRNLGTETMWHPIDVRLQNHAGRTYDVHIDPGPGGLAPGAGAAAAEGAELDFDFDGHNHLTVEIRTADVNSANNECVMSFSNSTGRYYCD